MGVQALRHPVGPAPLFMDSVIRERRGSCLAISAFYLCLGQALELPLYGVLTPGHIFVRYDDGKTRINVETLSRGAARADRAYRRKLAVPRTGRHRYLQNLTHREILGLCRFNLANAYRQAGRLERALHFYQAALEDFPALARAHGNLGVVRYGLGRYGAAVRAFERALEIHPRLPGARSHLARAREALRRGRENL